MYEYDDVYPGLAARGFDTLHARRCHSHGRLPHRHVLMCQRALHRQEMAAEKDKTIIRQKRAQAEEKQRKAKIKQMEFEAEQRHQTELRK